MESSYKEAAFQKKPARNDKARILQSTSAFITDVSHLDYLNQDSLVSNVVWFSVTIQVLTILHLLKRRIFACLPSNPSDRPHLLNPILSKRMAFRAPVCTPSSKMATARSFSLKVFQKRLLKALKRLILHDLSTCVIPKALLARTSKEISIEWLRRILTDSPVFRLIYRDLHPVEDTLRLQKSGISIGKKESSGSVRDWPLALHWSDADPSERFITETSQRYPQFIAHID